MSDNTCPRLIPTFLYIAESSWSRSRRGDTSPSSLPPADINLKLTSDQSSAATKDSQRRNSDRYRGQRGYSERYLNRQGGTQFSEVSGGVGYPPSRHGGPLSRSFSEGHGRPVVHGRPKREERDASGDSRESGKGSRRHHRSASTRDVADKEGVPLEKESRFGGLSDSTRRRDQKESVSNAMVSGHFESHMMICCIVWGCKPLHPATFPHLIAAQGNVIFSD